MEEDPAGCPLVLVTRLLPRVTAVVAAFHQDPEETTPAARCRDYLQQGHSDLC